MEKDVWCQLLASTYKHMRYACTHRCTQLHEHTHALYTHARAHTPWDLLLHLRAPHLVQSLRGALGSSVLCCQVSCCGDVPCAPVTPDTLHFPLQVYEKKWS